MPYGSVGGMERLALTFYNHYKAKGYEVKSLKFIKLDNDIINFGNDELFFKSYDFNKMKRIERILFYVKAPFLLRRIIKKEKISHSIAFGDMANIFSSLTFTKELKIGSLHALKSVELKNKTLLNKLLKICFKTSFKKFNKLICISNAIREDLIQNCYYPFSNLQIIYNPHDLLEIELRAKEKIIDDGEQLLFSGNVILFLGRLSHQKSPWHLIKSFYLLEKEKKDVKLVFIGDGVSEVVNYCSDLISELKLTDKVFFLGRKSNPYKYLAKSNVLALSSLYEGTPNVIVESICLGVPIVSSNCTNGIIELMSTEKVDVTNENIEVASGIITPNFYKGNLEIPIDNSIIEEERYFAKGLLQVLSDDRFERNISSNRDYLLNKFDVDQVSEEYLKPLKD